ncbi:MAG: hypothetical protein FGM46_09850 [Ferruginibacter sp.]|nr:hypothetical protein [Ferruginibacter sp.]
MLDACEDIITIIRNPEFKQITERSIPANLHIPNEDDCVQMIVFDFGICENKNGELEPQLIEMQGFPTIYGFQAHIETLVRTYADIPENFDAYLNGYNNESYIQLLKELIVENENPENVILLEIYPEEQKTIIDFRCTEKLLGIKAVCVTKIYAKENKLYYREGEKEILIKRIFNRLIFDDLEQQNVKDIIDLTKPYEVQWVPHPNWFYRISKYTLPFIQNQFVPETFFLNEVKAPLNLDEYVLKPLFSFAGMGVIIDVTQEDIDKIKDPQNWILQKKVHYADVIETPDGKAKAEIRLFYFWKKEWDKPKAVFNLARLSKGKMIGTRYNKDKKWVGGSIAFFEKE